MQPVQLMARAMHRGQLETRVVCNMAASNSRSTSYEVLNDQQKLTLRRFYDNGMTSTGANMQSVIAEATRQADTSFDGVKVRCLLK